MPPRYAYWTILIDGQATAFRAREREELLPTFNQLARKNTDIVMRYFARGRLWDNPEQAQWANRNPTPGRTEPRDRGWRPGGQHTDPRARFGEKKGRAGRGAGAGQPGRSPAEAFKGGRGGKEGPDRRPRFEDRTGKPEQRGPFENRERPKWSGKPKSFGKPRSFGKPKSFDRPKSHGQPGEERKTEFADRRDREFDARDQKPPGRWNRPPKRKPR
jgi:hypothetical protein